MKLIKFLFRLCRTDGTARFVKEAPDTITSWVITAFSLDAFHGLGVIQQPTKVMPQFQNIYSLPHCFMFNVYMNSNFRCKCFVLSSSN